MENVIDTEEQDSEISIQVSRLKVGDHSLKRKRQENADQNSSLLEGWSKAVKSRTWLCLGKLLLKLYGSVLTDADDTVNFIILIIVYVYMFCVMVNFLLQ